MLGRLWREESETEEVANCGVDRSSKAGVAITRVKSKQTLYKRCDYGDPSRGVWHAGIVSAERSPNASDSCPRYERRPIGALIASKQPLTRAPMRHLAMWLS